MHRYFASRPVTLASIAAVLAHLGLISMVLN
jgi:hypothetical protein